MIRWTNIQCNVLRSCQAGAICPEKVLVPRMELLRKHVNMLSSEANMLPCFWQILTKNICPVDLVQNSMSYMFGVAGVRMAWQLQVGSSFFVM